MTLKKLALELCKREGKKKSVDIAQMSEIVARLAEMFDYDPHGIVEALGYEHRSIFVPRAGWPIVKKKRRAK